jgi:ubiquinone/menaquinone biosynthesis C-methylase UbiE
MLRYAQKKAKVRGVLNVSFLQGGFLTYQHLGAPLDAAVTQIALHHLPDFWKQIALIRMAGMLKEGGRLCLRDVVYSFDPREHESFFEEYMSWARETMDSGFASRIASHVRAEYSTMDWIMKGLIERAGFEIERADYKKGMFALYLCMKRHHQESK